MKKVLLGSTALVGASLLAAAPVAAGEAPTLSFNGNTRVEISFSDQDLSDGRGRGYGFEVDSNTLTWKAKGSADNGMSYLAKVDVDMGGGDVTTSEASVTIADTWGTFVLGDDDGAETSMMVGGYSLMTAGYGYDGGYTAHVNIGGMAFDNVFASLVGDTGDSTKVTYFTPTFSGLQVGASWTPDVGHSFDGALSPDNNGDTENSLGLGLQYNGKVGDVGVRFGTTYVRATGESAAPFADREDINSWSIGGTLTFSGFSVGVGHGDSGDSNCTVANTLCDQGDWWDVAARYKFGSSTISAGYLSNESNAAGNATGDEVDVWTVGVHHSLPSAPGMSVWAEMLNFELDRNGTASDNDATYFMIGTQVSF